MDNYYLNNAVYLAETFLRGTTNPWFRLRYHQMFIPKAVARMEKTAPQGADTKSWRY